MTKNNLHSPLFILRSNVKTIQTRQLSSTWLGGWEHFNQIVLIIRDIWSHFGFIPHVLGTIREADACCCLTTPAWWDGAVWTWSCIFVQLAVGDNMSHQRIYWDYQQENKSGLRRIRVESQYCYIKCFNGVKKTIVSAERKLFMFCLVWSFMFYPKFLYKWIFPSCSVLIRPTSVSLKQLLLQQMTVMTVLNHLSTFEISPEI